MRLVIVSVLLVVAILLHPLFCVAQPSRSHNPLAATTVSVQELAVPRKAQQAFDKGTVLLAKGDVQASLAHLRTAIELAPAYFRAYHNLGVAQYRLGQFDEAAQDFQKAIDLSNGTYAYPFFGLSLVLYRNSEYSQAESVIRRGLLIAPGSALGKYCLGIVQFSLDQVNEARSSALDAIRIDPAVYDAHFLLAKIYDRLQDPAAALSELQLYFKLAPRDDVKSEAFALRQRAEQNLAHLSASVDQR